MPVRWKLFRVVCIIQMLAAAILGIMSLIAAFETGNFYTFIVVLLFVFIFLLTILAISLLNNNYPNVPVAGRQKSNFNRLFLINFLFLVFLFGVIFAEYRDLKDIAILTGKAVFELPPKLFIFLFSNIGVLVFQLIIFYGLYQLRRELYFNCMKKEFDFEKG
jgi:hypothetical protein